MRDREHVPLLRRHSLHFYTIESRDLRVLIGREEERSDT